VWAWTWIKSALGQTGQAAGRMHGSGPAYHGGVEQRDLGGTGLRVSALGFGCGAVGGLMVRGDRDEQTRAVARALDAGISYFDTAPSYGSGASEKNVGRALAELGAWDRAVVGTKVRFGPADFHEPRAAIRRSLEASLERLGRDSVDILHVHNPIGIVEREHDGVLGLAQVLGDVATGLNEVIAAGLVRHAGFTGVGDAVALRETVMAGPFATVQSYFNVFNPSAGYTGHSGGQQDFQGLIDTAARVGAGVIAIRVLAAGAATGSAERPTNAADPGPALVSGWQYDGDRERALSLAPLAAQLGLEGPLELAVRFALAKAGVSTVLVGYSTLEHLESAIRWAERGPLPDAAVRQLVQLAS